MPMLAGCETDQPARPQTSPPVAQQPRPSVFQVEGVSYASRDKALEAHRAMIARDLPKIEPVAQKVGGSLLVILPSVKQVEQNTYAQTRRQDEAVDWLADTVDANFHGNADAVRAGKIFDNVSAVVSDDAASVPTDGFAYKLWYERGDDHQFHWRLGQVGGKFVDLVYGKSWSNLERLKDFNISVVNAAADLGAPVAKVALPTGPNLVPPSQAPGLYTGTAFFINAGGFALTNAHVSNGCKSLKLVLPEGEVDANQVASDVQNDLAVIKAAKYSGAFAQFHGGTPVRQGEDIIAYGYPLAGALATQGNLTTGIVSALAGFGDDTRKLQISAPVQPGNSGGPLLNEEGHVVGVVTSKVNALNVARVTGDIPQNVNFAIKSGIATNFLDSNSIKYETSNTKVVKHTPDIGDLAKSYTYMVKCQR
jgi:S1-C subfamily serine protease